MCFGKKKQPENARAVTPPRPQDDFAIIQQFNQLYMKVRAWSVEFVGGAVGSELSAQQVALLRRLVLNNLDLAEVLADKTLHRHVIEGVIGIAIAEMLSSKTPSDTNALSETIYSQVTGFATSKTTMKELKNDLGAILAMAVSLQKSFATQTATFTVSYPRVQDGQCEFQTAMMEDKSNGKNGGPSKRLVGLLIFPGMFKVAEGVRTCMVKIKVICTDEMARYNVKVA
ncbi:hypothetical protein BZA77DRAFT_292978 [Pyronema omphalodes]|nr:hypothetical protein BZA77DRAFT_292978 [Pyronema omphalodes]